MAVVVRVLYFVKLHCVLKDLFIKEFVPVPLGIYKFHDNPCHCRSNRCKLFVIMHMAPKITLPDFRTILSAHIKILNY